MEIQPSPRWQVFLKEEIFVLAAGTIAVALLLGGYVSPGRIPAIIDWQLLLVLFALLVSVELVRESNLLARMVVWSVTRFRCGTIIASLANLLGWQIFVREHGPDPGFFQMLTIANFVFLVWAAVGGWLLMRAWL